MLRSDLEGTMTSPASSQTEVAYRLIRQAVVGGEFGIGQVLTETQLAAFCKVSRTPVREAVQRLEMEQVLIRGDRGLTIPDPSPEEIYDIYETRAILESSANRLAAERRTEVDLAHIDRWIETQRSMVDGSPSDHSAVNFEFGKSIWRASHNRSLFELLERIGIPHARFGGQTTMSLPGQIQRTIERHSAQRDAIAARDSELAAEIATTIAYEVRDLRIQMWHDRSNSLLSTAGNTAAVR
jgi:DNA-binding GntR family transcriptional regulator